MNVITPADLRANINRLASEKPCFEIILPGTIDKNINQEFPRVPEPDFKINYNGTVEGFESGSIVRNNIRPIIELVTGEYIRLHEEYLKLKNQQ